MNNIEEDRILKPGSIGPFKLPELFVRLKAIGSTFQKITPETLGSFEVSSTAGDRKSVLI
jgi:hypothetical protein